jgi:hypothetical protein
LVEQVLAALDCPASEPWGGLDSTVAVNYNCDDGSSHSPVYANEYDPSGSTVNSTPVECSADPHDAANIRADCIRACAASSSVEGNVFYGRVNVNVNANWFPCRVAIATSPVEADEDEL